MVDALTPSQDPRVEFFHLVVGPFINNKEKEVTRKVILYKITHLLPDASLVIVAERKSKAGDLFDVQTRDWKLCPALKVE
jgi:hypothetical protein